MLILQTIFFVFHEEQLRQTVRRRNGRLHLKVTLVRLKRSSIKRTPNAILKNDVNKVKKSTMSQRENQ